MSDANLVAMLYRAALLLNDATLSAQSPAMVVIRDQLFATPTPGDVVFEVSSFDRRECADPENRIGVWEGGGVDSATIRRLTDGEPVRWGNSEWRRLPLGFNPWRQP